MTRSDGAGAGRTRRGARGDGGGKGWPPRKLDLPGSMKKPPLWERGWSYKEWRRMLMLWFKVAGPHIGADNVGTLLLFSLKGRAQQVLFRMTEAQLEDFTAVVGALDAEYKWSPHGEGYAYFHAYIGHRRDTRSTGIDEFIIDHEIRHDRLSGSLLETTPLPDPFRAMHLLECAGLSEAQHQMVMATATSGGDGISYDAARATLKRLYGREAVRGGRRIPAPSGSGGGDGGGYGRGGGGYGGKNRVHVAEGDGDAAGAGAAWEEWEEGGEGGELGEEEGVFWEGESGEVFWVANLEDEEEQVYRNEGKSWRPAGKAGKFGLGGGRFKKGAAKGGKKKGGAKPSADNPCHVCGSPAHWARECPQSAGGGGKDGKVPKGGGQGGGRGKSGGYRKGKAEAFLCGTVFALGLLTTPSEASGAYHTLAQVWHPPDHSTGGGRTEVCFVNTSFPGEVLSASNSTDKSALGGGQKGLWGSLDSACTRSVMGLKRLHGFLKAKKHSPTSDTRKPVRAASNRSFLFGDGRLIPAMFRIWLPVVLAGVGHWMEIDVVPGILRLLVSRPTQEKLRSSTSLEVPGQPSFIAWVPSGNAELVRKVAFPVAQCEAGHLEIPLDFSESDADGVGAWLTKEQAEGLALRSQGLGLARVPARGHAHVYEAAATAVPEAAGEPTGTPMPTGAGMSDAVEAAGVRHEVFEVREKLEALDTFLRSSFPALLAAPASLPKCAPVTKDLEELWPSGQPLWFLELFSDARGSLTGAVTAALGKIYAPGTAPLVGEPVGARRARAFDLDEPRLQRHFLAKAYRGELLMVYLAPHTQTSRWASGGPSLATSRAGRIERREKFVEAMVLAQKEAGRFVAREAPWDGPARHRRFYRRLSHEDPSFRWVRRDLCMDVLWQKRLKRSSGFFTNLPQAEEALGARCDAAAHESHSHQPFVGPQNAEFPTLTTTRLARGFVDSLACVTTGTQSASSARKHSTPWPGEVLTVDPWKDQGGEPAQVLGLDGATGGGLRQPDKYRANQSSCQRCVLRRLAVTDHDARVLLRRGGPPHNRAAPDCTEALRQPKKTAAEPSVRKPWLQTRGPVATQAPGGGGGAAAASPGGLARVDPRPLRVPEGSVTIGGKTSGRRAPRRRLRAKIAWTPAGEEGGASNPADRSSALAGPADPLAPAGQPLDVGADDDDEPPGDPAGVVAPALFPPDAGDEDPRRLTAAELASSAILGASGQAAEYLQRLQEKVDRLAHVSIVPQEPEQRATARARIRGMHRGLGFPPGRPFVAALHQRGGDEQKSSESRLGPGGGLPGCGSDGTSRAALASLASSGKHLERARGVGCLCGAALSADCPAVRAATFTDGSSWTVRLHSVPRGGAPGPGGQRALCPRLLRGHGAPLVSALGSSRRGQSGPGLRF